MSSAAAARAEARRKAILSRGNDRLAKLTTSARGEEGGVFRDQTPPPGGPNTRSFLGEESSNMPTPRMSASPSPGPASQTHTPPPARKTSNPGGLDDFSSPSGRGASPLAAWLPEQQEQFLAALRHANVVMQQDQQNSDPAATDQDSQLPVSPLGEPSMFNDPSLPPMDNPFAALLGGAPGAGGGGGPGAMGFPFDDPKLASYFQQQTQQQQAPKPKTLLQKMMPLVHLLAVWALLAYFVLWVEPRMGGTASVVDVDGKEGALNILGGRFWRRWADLGTRSPKVDGIAQAFTVHVVPFFWAFTTLQLVLHSLRIFSGFDAVQPPALLSFALPHLPPPLPSIIINSLKYFQMGSLFLDDLSGLVVGIGFIIYFSGWITAA